MTAEDIARALGFKRSGNQWVGRCVAHNDKNPSMIIFEGRNGSAQVRCLSGCDPLDIIEALRARGMWAGSGRHDDIAIGLDELRRRRETPKTDPRRHQRRAFSLRDLAVDPNNVPHGYLRGRGLWPIPDALIKSQGGCVGYLPDCPRGDATEPAIIVLMRDVITFEPMAIQRIFLHEDPITGFVSKSGAMMLGPAGGAAMMLSSWEEIFAGREPEEGEIHLHVAEGFETALALYLCGVKPIWALGSAGAIARFPVLERINALVICADNDENGTGLNAAVECGKRWEQAGRSVLIRIPPKVGDDWCDHICGVRRPHDR